MNRLLSKYLQTLINIIESIIYLKHRRHDIPVKNFKKIKKAFVWLFVGIVGSVLSHFIIDFLYYNNNYEVARRVMLETRTEVFILGATILFVFYVLFSSMFGSTVLGVSLLLMVAWLIGMTTQYKSILRAEPLYPNEFYMVKQLPSLLQMIGTKRSILLIVVLVVVIVLLFLFYKYVIKARQQDAPSKKRNIIRIIGLVTSLGFLFYVGRFNYPNNKVKAIYSEHVHWVDYNQSKNYSDNGFIAGFLSNLKAPPMNDLENYSENLVKEIYEKYLNKAQNINQNRKNSDLDTNVLFVMNESFSDPFNLEGIESNEDPLTNYREIINETLRGNILAPNFGGGTATSEFEVLTGFAMEPFASHCFPDYITIYTANDSYDRLSFGT